MSSAVPGAYDMQKRFDTLLIAVCAYLMRRLRTLHAQLCSVDEDTWGQFVKLVALLLSFPCFEAHNFCFKLSYTLMQKRLRILGRECALMGGEDLSLQFEGLRIHERNVTKLHKSLNEVARRLESRKRVSDADNH